MKKKEVDYYNLQTNSNERKNIYFYENNTIMDEISVLENFFRSRQVLLARPWLESCINWCKQENLPRNYTIKDLQFNVFEQWLLLDLRDVEIPCLPPDLSSMVNYTLTGNYSLQVMQVEDTSKPKLWQLQKIRRGFPKNLEQEAETSKRALLVTLSDGVQEVKAMEYQPVKCLNLNLSPGIKVRLMGAVNVRRGRLLLTERNIKILGGEVESLLVPNAAENVLAKHLRLPMNMEPAVIQESILTAETTLLDEGENITSQLHTGNSSASRAPSNQTRIQSRSSVNVPEQNYFHHISDEINHMENEQSIIEDEINMLMEVEREFEESRGKRRKPNGDAFHNVDIDDAVLENIQIPETVENPPPEIPNISKHIHDESDFFADIDLDAHLEKIEEESKPNSSQAQIWTIGKLSKNLPDIGKGKFKIRAKFKSVVQKMGIIDNEFQLVVKVTDDVDDIDVKLHTNVIADFFGCSASAATELKSEVKKQNLEAQTKLLDGLRRLKDELTKLDRIAEVQVIKGDRFPVVVRLL